MQHLAIRIFVSLVTFFVGITAANLSNILSFDTDSYGVAEREVLEVERDYVRAHLERDVAALELILADDFSSFGGRVNKTRRLALIASPFFTVTELSTTDVRVQVEGDEARVTGRAKMRARTRDREYASPPYDYTRRYVHRDGRWQIVHLSFSLSWR